jgi:glucosamine 6-phosphate synthetase-like amidotransferase/phosphosugar isomerase protein
LQNFAFDVRLIIDFYPPDGSQIAMTGVFREIIVYSKIIQDEKHVIGSSDDGFTNETVVTIAFEKDRKKTIVKTCIDYGSKEQRDEALFSHYFVGDYGDKSSL